MSLDLEQALKVFFASAPQTVHPIQTIEISHPSLSTVWRLWREPVAGTITTPEDGAVAVLPANIEIALAGSEGTLDQRFQIKLGTVDIEDAFRAQMDLIPIDTVEKITVIYREYLSDNLAEPQAVARLEVESISYAIGAATLSAVSPRLNLMRTGLLYTPRDIPMLRGFL
jgi:hypothetical protein